MRVTAALILSLGFLIQVPMALAQSVKRPFTVADDISLTLFNVQGGGSPELHFSPDGKYFAVWTERGRLGANQVEDSLRFYRTEDVEAFLVKGGAEPPSPAWVLSLSAKQNPVIDKWKWLADSSGVAFLRASGEGIYAGQQLVLANLRQRKVEPLMLSAEDVRAFDVRDAKHFVYVVADHSEWDKRNRAESQAVATVGTGSDLWKLAFADVPLVRKWSTPSTKELWAVVDGKRFEVKHNGQPPAFDELFFSLSPDGRWLATLAPVENVPASWTKLYPPPPVSVLRRGRHASAASDRSRPWHGDAIRADRPEIRSGKTNR